MQEIIQVLQSSHLFRDISDAYMKTIAPRFSVKSMSAGEIIFDDSAREANGMFVIAEGAIKIFKRVAGDDDRQQAVAILKPGNFFGEMALLDEEVRSAGAQAVSDGKLLFLSREAFHELISENLELGHTLLLRLSQVLTKRLRDTNNLFREVVTWGYRARKEVRDLKSNFLSTISHELRTPIHSIQGFSSLMKEADDQDPEMQRKFVEVIIGESKRLGDLINDLIALAEMEYGGVVLQKREIRVDELVTKAFDEYRFLAGERRLSYNIRTETSQVVHVDADRLTDAVGHLIENAIKFTAFDGRVELHCYEEMESIRIAVEDSGRGIAARNVERIFEKFYQVDQSSTREVEGAGIGLSLARHIVDLHGGRIEVVSHEEKGSTFTIILPKTYVLKSSHA